MKKIFIYYSLSGNGNTVAEYLLDKNIDVRKVIPVDKIPKSRIGSILTGGFLASINYKIKLVDFNSDISSYDEIIIGSPVWNDRLSCPINTVLDKIKLDNKKVTFILYSGSGKSTKASKKINKLYNANIINLVEPKKNDKELDKLSQI